MNYQHAFHAGAIADVFKHIVLIQLLKSLQKKETPFCYLETHAGNAGYDLREAPSLRTNEFKKGILPLWQAKGVQHEAILTYLDLIRSHNPNEDKINFYPGSSVMASHYLRTQDEAILCELNPPIYEALYDFFKKDKQVHVHQRNGYDLFSALIPPKIKRGLVLIDPPYEVENEYELLLNAMKQAKKNWPTGMYAIWFPIKSYHLIANFYRNFKQLGFDKVLVTEFWEGPQDVQDAGIRGSGLVIVNPPWQLDTLLTNLLPALRTALNLDDARVLVEWLCQPSAE